jgi:hypothetical protein
LYRFRIPPLKLKEKTLTAGIGEYISEEDVRTEEI